MLFKNIRIILVALCLCKISSCVAQLTFHTDPLSNSFTLKTPGLQQSFTRYFGGKQRGNLFQGSSAALQQQPQQYQTQQQSQYQPQPQLQNQYQYQPQYQSQYQPQYQQQYQQIRQPFGQPQLLQQSSGQSTYPFEAAYEQPQQQSSPYAGAYPGQASQFTSAYRAAEYPVQAQPPQAAQAVQAQAQQGMPSYADQLQQGIDSYQQEQQQMQQMLQQQQYHQQQLLMDLYKHPQGQGRAVTNSPGRSQAFYTADQYINFLNKQHQDVFQQQQNVSDRGYSFSPMSAYTNGVASSNGMQMNMGYSPASNSSRVSYTNGKLSYNF